MRENLLRRRLQQGEMAFGHMVMEFATRGLARILEAARADFVVLDMEHSGLGLEKVADQMAWFKATSVSPMVRVPALRAHFITRCLDAGALGIMVPNVETAEQAEQVVQAARYAPRGSRGLGLGGAHNDYIPPPTREYLEEANRNISVICQVESARGLENVEALAAVDGVDVLWVGHFDLTQSMGIVGEFDHPRFLEALDRVVDAARRHGRGAGIQPGSLQQAEEWRKRGFNVISFGTDVGVYRAALTEAFCSLRKWEDGV